ncbi:MAG: hypothetical protein WB684_04440 [Gaiella sp.]
MLTGFAGLHEPVADPADVFGEECPAELGERGCGWSVLEGTENRFALLYLKRQDAGAVPVSGLEAFGECLVVNESRELEDVGAGDGKAGGYIAGMVRSLHRGVWRGAPPGVSSVHG